ncbi:MAG: transglycosylase SLT domain-containing protein [Candidatus Eisenbacteria bacterium]|nr:transglycosylase SLT domain-containing protein [Candidatus Eisenbacteria bacterium]
MPSLVGEQPSGASACSRAARSSRDGLLRPGSTAAQPSTPATGRSSESQAAALEPNAYESSREGILRALKPWESLIQRAAEEARIAPNWIRAVVFCESSGRPEAVSSKGARGLMQLMPETAREMGVRDPFDPLQNLRGGAGYLKKLLLRFDHPTLALAAYHAGPGRVERSGGMPPIAGTRRYVNAVTSLKRWLDAVETAASRSSSDSSAPPTPIS